MGYTPPRDEQPIVVGSLDQLQRLLVAGANITIALVDGDFVITATGGGIPLGAANQLLGMNAAGDDYEWKTLIPGDNVTIDYAPGTITINSAGAGPAYFEFEGYFNAEFGNSIAGGKNNLLAIDGAGNGYVGVSNESFDDSYVLKFDAATGEVLATSPVQSGLNIQKMCLSPDGSKLYAYTRFDDVLIVYDTSDMSELHNASFGMTTVYVMDISPDGSQLVFSTQGGTPTVYIVDTATYAVTSFSITGNTGTNFVCFAPNGNLYISYSVAGGATYDQIFEYDTSGTLIDTFTLGLPGGVGSRDAVPFGVDMDTGIIYGVEYTGGTNAYAFAYDPSGPGLLGYTDLGGESGKAVGQGLAFPVISDGKAYLTTSDDADTNPKCLVSIDNLGVATIQPLTDFAAFSLFYSVVIANGQAYIYGQKDANYGAVVCLQALP